MIPIKDKTYKIHYIDENDSSLSYIGKGVYTGDTEQDVDGSCLFLFAVENLLGRGFTDTALFADKDIITPLD